MINNRDSPIIAKIVCLLFERGINPNVLVPRMGNVGYFQRYFHVISLLQVSKELHLNFVDILRPNRPSLRRNCGTEGRLMLLLKPFFGKQINITEIL
jgi:hypothetical protein